MLSREGCPEKALKQMIKNKIKNCSKQLERKKEKRLYPYKDTTPLSEFIAPKYHVCLRELLRRIQCWLSNPIPDRLDKITRLDFDWTIEGCTPTNVAREFASFFTEAGGTIENTLSLRTKGKKWTQSVFFRYLTSAEHGNFTQTEIQLKSLFNKALRELINKD